MYYCSTTTVVKFNPVFIDLCFLGYLKYHIEFLSLILKRKDMNLGNI